MRLYEYQRSRSFINLGPIQSDSIFLNLFSSLTADFNITSALRWAIQDQWSSGWFLFASFCLHGRHSRSDEQSHSWVILNCISLIIQQIWPGPAPSDSTHWRPSSWLWFYLVFCLYQVLLWLVLSDLPWRHSRSDEQSHDWMILTRVSLIIQQILLGPVQLDSPRWLSSINDQRHGWVILPRIS